jgi:hypothetical protein
MMRAEVRHLRLSRDHAVPYVPVEKFFAPMRAPFGGAATAGSGARAV